MKKIESIIRPEKLDDVLAALDNAGCSGISISEIRGHGAQKGIEQQWRGEKYKVSFLPKVKIEIVARDSDVARLKEVIVNAARTGDIGDGKIFIYTLDETIKIRTGQSGDEAI